jgi:predicted glycoside hydrolase/deacetylase ChbG (UPF0249 family)
MIVNADDFGFSTEVNEAIIRAHREGVLTSASLMVTGAAFDEAVRLARENPRLGVGIHLVTVMGRSALPTGQVPSITDEHGNFSSNPVIAGLKYFFSLRARRELRRELEAQFERFKSTGLPLSHVDGHFSSRPRSCGALRRTWHASAGRGTKAGVEVRCEQSNAQNGALRVVRRVGRVHETQTAS